MNSTLDFKRVFWRCALIVPIVLIVANTPSSYAQADLAEAALWVNDYKNLPIVIEHLKATDIVSEGTVQTKTELRLRQAGIRPSTPTVEIKNHFLSIQVQMVGQAFRVEAKFFRLVKWELPNGPSKLYSMATWEDGIMGTHGSDGSYVIGALDTVLDRFLNAYLR